MRRGGGGGGSGKGDRSSAAERMERAERERERTRVRERRRRSITTRMLEGLRRHGGYRLPPRPDINDVLRALAAEAGWVVLPDGTTYRRPTATAPFRPPTTPHSLVRPHPANNCAATGRGGDIATPTSSRLISGGDGDGVAPLHAPPLVGPTALGGGDAGADVASYVALHEGCGGGGVGGGNDQARHAAYAAVPRAWGSTQGEPLD